MEKYLNKCLNSLIVPDSNTMKHIEVLVIIDGATDQSSKIAHAYQNEYPDTFRVIDKKNGNYGSCINCGLKVANGKYVKILDADDYFQTNNFNKFLYILQEQDVDLIITNFDYVNVDDKIIEQKHRNLPKNQTLDFSKAVSDFNTNLISMHELTYKTDILRSISYHQTEGISYTDLEWCFMPMTKVKTLVYFDIVLYKYLIGRADQTVAPDVALKMLPHKMKSGINMALQYEKITDLDIEHMSYINRRISWSLGAIYYNYLITYNKCLPLEELIKFDCAIQEKAPNVYKLLSEEILNPKLHIKYIAYWRSNKYKIPLILKLSQCFISIYQKTKK